MNRLHHHRLWIIFLFMFFLHSAMAEVYRVSFIPDSLRQGAVAVTREFTAILSQRDANNAVFKVHQVITVLNERGDRYANFTSHKDAFTDFKKFEGTLRNAEGKVIKKIKRSHLVESNISDEMASDMKMLLYEVNSPVYPYTVEYAYEQQLKNGVIAYPSFMPIGSGGESVEKATYRVEVPLDVELRYLSNFDCDIKEERTDKQRVYSFSCGAIKALEYEPLADFSKQLPRVRVAPREFCFDKVSGDLSTWGSFGLWQNKLLAGRDVLPPSFAEEIKSMVKDASSDREKVEILYHYLQKNTRYVSIQLGIGGWQPISAESTLKNKYGDCKGLTNLMMAMLKVVDVPSNYTIIRMGNNKRLLKDFPDMAQTNHVILLVPLKNDTIWLECTSSSLPVGYIHDDIAGHDAVVMTAQGGVFCTLPSYSSEKNLTESTIVMELSDDGKIHGTMEFNEYLHGYSYYHRLMQSNDRELHVEYVNRYLNFSKLNLGEIATSENLSETPSCFLKADFMAENYVTQTGQRMFIPMVPLRKSYFDILKAKERRYDIVISQGFSESDSIVIKLPKGYIIESMPKGITKSLPYGMLDVRIEKTPEGDVIYKQWITINEGVYSKGEYDEIKAFFQSIAMVNRSRLVIKK